MKHWAFSFIFFLSTAALAESAAGVKWAAPARWTKEEPRSMRVATYSIAPAKGDPEAAECAVFFFGPGQGGTVDANIDRWAGQFQTSDGKPVSKPRAQKSTKNGVSITRVDVEGTYIVSAGPMSPVSARKPGYKLLGAIVEAPEGPVFFKLTGPARTVNSAKSDFERLLNSISR